MVNASTDDSECHAREDVSIVSLARVEGLALVGDSIKGGTRGKDSPAFSVVITVLGGTLSLGEEEVR